MENLKKYENKFTTIMNQISLIANTNKMYYVSSIFYKILKTSTTHMTRCMERSIDVMVKQKVSDRRSKE